MVIRNKFVLSLFVSTFCVSLFGATYTDKNGKVGAYINDADRRSGLALMQTQYDWTRGFWEEFSISAEPVTCKAKDPKDGLLGFKSTLQEPIYIADTTVVNNEVPSLGFELGSWRPDKQGTATKNGGIYSNIMKFPLAGVILKEKTGGIYRFEEGSPKIIYFSAIDPIKWWDVLNFDLNIERGLFATVLGALASGPSCVANTALDKLSGQTKRKDSGAGKQLRAIIDTLYYSIGCKGSVPMGSIPVNDDPIASSILTSAHTIYAMHSKRGVVNALEVGHVTLNVLNGYDKEILCNGSRRFVPPWTQYTTQLVSPTVAKNAEFGVSAIEYSFKGGISTGKRAIWLISQRRDYAALVKGGAMEDGQSAAHK